MLATNCQIYTGFLGLNKRQRFAIISKQHIVNKPFTRAVGHTIHRIFIDPVVPFNPTTVCKHNINILLSCFKLGGVFLWDVCLGLLGSLGSQLCFEFLILLDEFFNVDINRMIQKCLILLVGKCGVILSCSMIICIEICHHIHKVKEILKTESCLVFRDCLAGVSGNIAKFPYVVHVIEHLIAHNVTELFCAHKNSQRVVVVRQNQICIN